LAAIADIWGGQAHDAPVGCAVALYIGLQGVDWRRGESVYLEHLLDADMQQNNGNWQWVAGVGTDAAPYFRIFNPTLQAKKFDPDGTYVRRWVPELAHLPNKLIHEPWRSPDSPVDYPLPILDHAEARARTLARYRSV